MGTKHSSIFFLAVVIKIEKKSVVKFTASFQKEGRQEGWEAAAGQRIPFPGS